MKKKRDDGQGSGIMMMVVMKKQFMSAYSALVTYSYTVFLLIP